MGHELKYASSRSGQETYLQRFTKSSKLQNETAEGHRIMFYLHRGYLDIISDLYYHLTKHSKTLSIFNNQLQMILSNKKETARYVRRLALPPMALNYAHASVPVTGGPLTDGDWSEHV